jgi:hypothetical protein
LIASELANMLLTWALALRLQAQPYACSGLWLLWLRFGRARKLQIVSKRLSFLTGVRCLALLQIGIIS